MISLASQEFNDQKENEVPVHVFRIFHGAPVYLTQPGALKLVNFTERNCAGAPARTSGRQTAPATPDTPRCAQACLPQDSWPPPARGCLGRFSFQNDEFQHRMCQFPSDCNRCCTTGNRHVSDACTMLEWRHDIKKENAKYILGLLHK